MPDSPYALSEVHPDPRRDEFIALLQARASELISTAEAKGRLKTLYPEWFDDEQEAS